MIPIKALEEKIIEEGKVLPGNILKVGNFLNHQLDVKFLMQMGKEITRLYADYDINKILTIESSGIAIAVAAANFMDVPVVFAKKSKSKNISSDVYSSPIKSFTHNTVNNVIVSRDFLHKGDKVLVVDDFLAEGNALVGLIDIIKSADAEFVGAAIAIEKGFQGGGDMLREKGYNIESLAIIEKMTDCGISFRK